MPGKDLRLVGVAFCDDGQAESVFSQTLPLANGKVESTVRGFLKLKPGKYRIKLATERFERLFRGWQEKYRLEEELMFTNGEESYQPVEGQEASGSLDSAYSIGEFAAALRNAFAPESSTSFRLEEAEEIAGRQTVGVAYRIPRESSFLQLTCEGNPLRVGYRGLCWIDVDSFQVVRLIKETADLPEDFPIKRSEMSTAYDWIQIGGRQHWLPVRAQFDMSVGILQSVRAHTRNVIRFTDYQQFETDVKLLLE